MVFCHQDVRLDLGHGYNQLAAQVATLNARPSAWVVAGNAGGDHGRYLLAHLNEPDGQFRLNGLPLPVRSLDENFLLLRRGRSPFASPDLHGFHLYGTDVCLNVIACGGTAHIIDFLLTHLSGGNAATPEFAAARERLVRYWSRYFLAGIVRPPCTDFYLTSNRLGDYLFRRRRPRAVIQHILKNPLVRHPWRSPPQ